MTTWICQSMGDVPHVNNSRTVELSILMQTYLIKELEESLFLLFKIESTKDLHTDTTKYNIVQHVLKPGQSPIYSYIDVLVAVFRASNSDSIAHSIITYYVFS